jgi:uncharacterized protein (DUF433 family)
MTLSIHADLPPLRQAEDGVVRIANTRIPLERVVRAFLNGMTPEQIAHDFDVFRVEDVYAVINYYLHHREEVDAYMAEAEKDAAKIKDDIEKRCDSAGIRARLLARRRSEACQ